MTSIKLEWYWLKKWSWMLWPRLTMMALNSTYVFRETYRWVFDFGPLRIVRLRDPREVKEKNP